MRDGRIERTESWLIQPPFNEYEYRNTLIHGITAEDTALAPDFAEVWWEIAPLLAEGPLLAHNAPFDIRVLRALIASHELVAPSYEYVCTVALARRAFPELRRHTLDVMCDHCGITLSAPRRGLRRRRLREPGALVRGRGGGGLDRGTRSTCWA